MRGIKSFGMLLCASNEEHTVVEPLTPPEGAEMGERLNFCGSEVRECAVVTRRAAAPRTRCISREYLPQHKLQVRLCAARASEQGAASLLATPATFMRPL